ncbi:neuronal acetylcholine receptor subunit alpha-9-like isoform X2 [Hydractinia symbiolongicarpus]|uniref:neuronal acetylcholine receptor subunit alpha-9-like isoform X2 n=1 Tax=Hydractinia symbiolongicarpus TaxID=13093 RepID=UPI0025516993|nr:neuronal acetylcholine receptor subunit alpha-9-like isoform X2 [Hydractinia symbiolongicarpus]
MLRNFAAMVFVLSMIDMSNGAIESVQGKLIKSLFTNYSKQVRPVTHQSLPVNATFGIELMQIIKVSWINMLMKWEPTLWGGIKSVQVDADMVWTPDIVLYNNADDTFTGGTEKYKTRITLEYTGQHNWLAPATFTHTCAINIRYFPFDKQVCILKFGSWTFNKAGITLFEDPRPVITSQYVVSSEWEILSVEKTVNSILYECCADPYMDATFTLNLLRKPLYYVFNVITPCLVLVTTILFGFFLPPESGERISLTITILLAVAVFLQLISDTLPRNSETIPVLAIFYMVVMTESALSLITTCIVLIIHHRSSEKGAAPMPTWVRHVFLNVLAKYLGIRVSSKSRNECDKDFVKTESGANIVYHLGQHHTDKRSPQDGSKYHINNSNGYSRHLINGSAERRLNNRYTNDLDTHHTLQDMLAEQRKENVSKDKNLNVILNELQMITSVIQHKSYHEKIQEEWKSLAKVLDRLFFWLFLLTVVVSATSILLPAYYINH